MTERAVALRREASTGGGPCEELLDRIEDVLSEGYALALAGDAESMRSEERLHEIISDTTAPVRGATLRAIAADHASLERAIIELRRMLADLRHERDRLLAGAPPTAALRTSASRH